MKTIKVVAAIIKKDDRIFITQRGSGEYKGLWEFPGGKVEINESNDEALKREIMEELGVTISVNNHVHTVEYDYPNFHLSMDCYFSTITEGEITLFEHQSAKWVTKDELEDIEWIEADVQIIDVLLKMM